LKASFLKLTTLPLLLLLLLLSDPVLAAKAKPVSKAVSETASDTSSGLSLGVGWPYVGLKYDFNRELGAEFRFSTLDGINVFAGRGYWNFVRSGNFGIFTGLEGGYISFDTMNADDTARVSGTGYEIAPFFGVDYFLDQRFSILFDFSMPIINVTSKTVSLGDLQWVANGGLYFYPF
jgi:hypothetical protein